MDRALLAWGLRPGGNTTRGMACVLTHRHDDRRSQRRDGTTGQTASLLPNPRMPRLWLFTDHRRLPDPRTAVAALPPARAGVVLRHDSDPARATLGQDLARICRARRLVLVVAGDPRLAASLGAGVHLRAGRWSGPLRPRGMVTSSAHGVADMRRAARAGADLVFLSPA